MRESPAGIIPAPGQDGQERPAHSRVAPAKGELVQMRILLHPSWPQPVAHSYENRPSPQCAPRHPATKATAGTRDGRAALQRGPCDHPKRHTALRRRARRVPPAVREWVCLAWKWCGRSIRPASRSPAPPRRRPRSVRCVRGAGAGRRLLARSVVRGPSDRAGRPLLPSRRLAALDCAGRGEPLRGCHAQPGQPLLLLGGQLRPGTGLLVSLESFAKAVAFVADAGPGGCAGGSAHGSWSTSPPARRRRCGGADRPTPCLLFADHPARHAFEYDMAEDRQGLLHRADRRRPAQGRGASGRRRGRPDRCHRRWCPAGHQLRGLLQAAAEGSVARRLPGGGVDPALALLIGLNSMSQHDREASIARCCLDDLDRFRRVRRCTRRRTARCHCPFAAGREGGPRLVLRRVRI